MCNIPYVTRSVGRYSYRRRIHFRNIISKPIMLALRTSDPTDARSRSAMLSARFVQIKHRVSRMIEQQRPFLSGDEIEALFRLELETELTKIMADAYLSDSYSPYVADHARVVSESYRIAKRPDRPTKLDPDYKADLLARGFDPLEFDFIEQDLADRCYTDDMADTDITDRLAKIGVGLPKEQLESARSHMLRARADAWRRAMRMFDKDVADAANPIAALMGDGNPAIAVTRPEPTVFVQAATSDPGEAFTVGRR